MKKKITEKEDKLTQEYRECYANNPHLLELAKKWEKAGIESWLNYEKKEKEGAKIKKISLC